MGVYVKHKVSQWKEFEIILEKSDIEITRIINVKILKGDRYFIMIIIAIFGLLLKIVLILLIAILVILFLILIISFEYKISAVVKEKANFYFRVHWTLFEVELMLEDLKPFIKIRLFGRIVMNQPPKKRVRKKREKKASKSSFKMPGLAFFQEILKFLKELFNIFKPKEIMAFGYYGLNDPAHTAVVSFVINLLSDLVPLAQIRLEPIFESEMIDVEINISGRIRLMVLVYILIKYLFKREVRKVVFQKRIHTEA